MITQLKEAGDDMSPVIFDGYSQSFVSAANLQPDEAPAQNPVSDEVIDGVPMPEVINLSADVTPEIESNKFRPLLIVAAIVAAFMFLMK